MSDRIREAQERLGRLLGAARAAEDRDLARRVRELGEQLARLLHGLLRLARLHAATNRAFDKPVADLCRLVAEVVGLLGTVEVVCVEGQVYVNDLRTRFDTDPEHAVALGEALERHHTGGLGFHGPITDADARAMVRLLIGPPAPSRPRAGLEQALVEQGVTVVAPLPPQKLRIDAEGEVRSVREVYRDAAHVVGGVLGDLTTGRQPNPLPIRRLIHELLARLAAGDGPRLAWEVDSSLPLFARHTVMVTNLSLVIGRAAGLPEETLTDLGMAAVLHDIGHVARRDGRPAPSAGHARAALPVLLRQRGFHQARVRRLLAILTHHRPFSASPRPSLYSRVIHIADDYDLLTRQRPGDSGVRTPAEAIRLMAAAGGREYDPTLVQAFVNTMGPYPPGTILELEDRRRVTSISGVRSADTFDRPLTRVARLADGSLLRDETLVDLAREGHVARLVSSRRQDS